MIADYTLNLSDGEGAVAFDVIAEVTDADYEWSSDAVLKRCSDGALFFVQDSGCSCYGFGENITLADLKPIQKIEEAYRLVDPLDRERLQRSYERGEIVDR